MGRKRRKGPPSMLKSWREDIGALGSIVGTASSKLVAALEGVIGDQIAAGTEPDGKPWRLTKKGKQPLVNAARAVLVRARGKVLTVTIKGHHARHHLGAIRGKVKRRILPSKGLPSPYADAVRKVLIAEFTKTIGGTS